MSWTERWAWKIYLILYSLIVLGNMVSLFYEESYLYIYYHILIAFEKSYRFYYWYAIIGSFVNLISLIGLFLFVFRTKFLHPYFWEWLFVFRIVFDLIGHSFEFQTMKSFFLTDLQIAGLMAAFTVGLFLPSYLGTFLYAFRQHKIFAQ